MTSQRPDSVSFVAISEIMFAPLGLLVAIATMLLNAIVTSVLFFFFGIIWLVSGLGLLNRRRWSRNFSILTAVLSLALSFFGFFSILIFVFAPALIFWPVVLYKLTRPQVKSFLEEGNRTEAPSQSVVDV